MMSHSNHSIFLYKKCRLRCSRTDNRVIYQPSHQCHSWLHGRKIWESWMDFEGVTPSQPWRWSTRSEHWMNIVWSSTPWRESSFKGCKGWVHICTLSLSPLSLVPMSFLGSWPRSPTQHLFFMIHSQMLPMKCLVLGVFLPRSET